MISVQVSNGTWLYNQSVLHNYKVKTRFFFFFFILRISFRSRTIFLFVFSLLFAFSFTFLFCSAFIPPAVYCCAPALLHSGCRWTDISTIPAISSFSHLPSSFACPELHSCFPAFFFFLLFHSQILGFLFNRAFKKKIYKCLEIFLYQGSWELCGGFRTLTVTRFACMRLGWWVLGTKVCLLVLCLMVNNEFKRWSSLLSLLRQKSFHH